MAKVHTPEAIAELRAVVQMTPEEAIEGLTYIPRGENPSRALVAATAWVDEVTPRLLQELALSPEDVEARYQSAPDDLTAYYLHTFAIYLLGSFCEPRAWPLILDFFTSNPELSEDLEGEATSGALQAILARCYDGSGLSRLTSIILTERFDLLFRHACLQAYHGLVLSNRVSRSGLIAFVEKLLEQETGEDQDWAAMLASAAAELKEPQLKPKIEALFDTGVIQDSQSFLPFINRKDIAVIYGESDEDIAETILKEEYFDILIDHIRDWWWFLPYHPREVRAMDAAERAYDSYANYQPYVRETPKTGRNDPCPCGSGKKHKKCCLRAED